MGLLPKHYLFPGDTNQISVFFLHKTKMSKRHRFKYLNHWQSVKYLPPTLPVGIGNTLVALKCVLKCILFLAKLKVERRPFLEGASIRLSSKLPLTYGDNVNHYKSTHQPPSTLPVGIKNTLPANKLRNNYAFFVTNKRN